MRKSSIRPSIEQLEDRINVDAAFGALIADPVQALSAHAILRESPVAHVAPVFPDQAFLSTIHHTREEVLQVMSSPEYAACLSSHTQGEHAASTKDPLSIYDAADQLATVLVAGEHQPTIDQQEECIDEVFQEREEHEHAIHGLEEAGEKQAEYRRGLQEAYDAWVESQNELAVEAGRRAGEREASEQEHGESPDVEDAHKMAAEGIARPVYVMYWDITREYLLEKMEEDVEQYRHKLEHTTKMSPQAIENSVKLYEQVKREEMDRKLREMVRTGDIVDIFKIKEREAKAHAKKTQERRAAHS